MKKAELEDELLAICQDFMRFSSEYETLTEVERTIRNVYSRSAEERDKLYPARETLAEFVRNVALESNQARHTAVQRFAARILKRFEDERDNSREIEAVELIHRLYPHVDSAALREEIDEFMLADDEPENPRETEGDLRMHDPEGKA